MFNDTTALVFSLSRKVKKVESYSKKEMWTKYRQLFLSFYDY